MDNNTLLVILSLVAGVVGTGFGGIIGVMLKGKGNKVMGRVLSFAGGVMVGVVCFDMLPESVKSSQGNIQFSQAGILISILSLSVGMLVIYLLNKLLDVLENMRSTHKQLAELHHETKILEAKDISNESRDAAQNRKSLMKAGIIMLVAIALHNFPEGMAIGASGAADLKMGIIIAIILAVHNIPEGMAISAPLASGGVGAFKTILLTTLAGAATVFGALLGIAIGGINDIAVGVCMGLAGGAMLYVTFCEILPEATLMEEGRVPAASMLIGIICAALFVFMF